MRTTPKENRSSLLMLCRGWCLSLWLTALGSANLQSQSPTLTSDHFNYFAGEDIVIEFRNGPGNPKDWIGLYPPDVVPGPVASTRWLYLDSQNGTTGLREGSVTFPGGLDTAGNWAAYFLLNDGYTQLATNLFTVVDPTASLVRPNKRIYAPGESISVLFTNGPANPKDWIGLYREGEAPGGPDSTLWSYVDGTQSGAKAKSDGVIVFSGGLASVGNYVAFFLLNDGYEVLASEPFTVAAPGAAGARVLSVQPANNTTNLSPVVEFVITITNGTSQVVSNSVKLAIDGTVVGHTYAQQDGLVTITYTNTTLFAPASAHTARWLFQDNATPTRSYTNDIQFAIANYRNIVLPAPLYFENFDSTPEGQLPAGWAQKSYTDAQNPEVDFANLDSAAYANWTVVAAARFQGAFITYSNPTGSPAEQEDYHRVLSINRLNVVNGQVLNEPLAQGRFLFGDSGYRNGQSQVLFAFTPDFNLAGKTNVYLSFHSLWEQNQDSIGAVEFSVDSGTTWLPIVYLLNSSDVLLVTNETTGAVSADAVATFTTEYGDVARYTDENGEEKGGTYGAFIAAPITPDLASFISPRVDDNPVESKRVELFRLPQADNQAKVRFRFAHAGTDSWYFGIDDFGLYSIPPGPTVPPTLTISRSGSSVVLSWPADQTGYTLESSSNLTSPRWNPVNGVSNNTVTLAADTPRQFYRLRQ